LASAAPAPRRAAPLLVPQEDVGVTKPATGRVRLKVERARTVERDRFIADLKRIRALR
jgi:hypothetical protein